MSESSKRLRPTSYRNRKKPAHGADLVGVRWNPEAQAQASRAGAVLNRKRKRKSGGRRALCQCGQCLQCYNRERKRESRARLKRN